MLCKANSTVFYFNSWYTHTLLTFSVFGLLRRKEKGRWLLRLSLSLHVIMGGGGWLTQGWVGNVTDFCGRHWRFLEHPCLLSVLKNFWFWHSVGSGACPCPMLWPQTLTWLPCRWAPCVLGEPEHPAQTSAPAHTPLPLRLHSQSTSSRVRSFKTVTEERQPHTGHLCPGPRQHTAQHTPVRPLGFTLLLPPSPFTA